MRTLISLNCVSFDCNSDVPSSSAGVSAQRRGLHLVSPPESDRQPAGVETNSRLRTGLVVAAILFLLLTVWLIPIHGQQAEPSLPLSQRSTINLAAGVPQYIANAASTSSAAQSPWLFQNTSNSTQYATQGFVEGSNWTPIGVPYDANISRTFINQTSGGGAGSLTSQQNWYRLHFKVDPKYAGQKFLLNLEGSHTALQVFINGQLLPGISQVTADAQATHVVGFIPVIVDLTPYIHADGMTDNVIAVDVSRGDPWFELPNFSGAFRFGQAMAGLFRNVFLYVTNPVHIPLNVYSNQKTWGTYVGTKSITASASATATAASALVEVQTNVLNESNAAQQVTLTTQIVDASGNVVVTAPPMTQTVPAMTPATFPASATPMFDQTITVPNPTLWYPNNSIYGKPYMYRVYHIVSVNGVVVDSAQSPLGIRVITWDSNFPYFNGHQQYLWGASGRYDYPALGSAVPDEQVWRDLAQFAASGGNVWRPGHSTSSEEFVAAADAYGIMIDQPSGDGEGYWGIGTNGGPTADDSQLKQELHRDMIIRDRNHPSILDWEEDNGGMNATLAAQLATLENTWDTIQLRKQATRSGTPAYAFINECDSAGCEVGLKNPNSSPDSPAFGAEYWDNVGTGRGLAYDNELAFAAPYLNDWQKGREANAFGMAQWYFADTPGEVSLWSEDQTKAAPVAIDPNYNKPFDWSNYVRSLGYSMVDQNRFPRLLYYIYEANWVPYSIKPVVALAHHWNRAYEYTAGTPIQVNAFSNCPMVRLLVNGAAKDPVSGAQLADLTPNAWNFNSSDLTQSTTSMPGQVHWMVNYAPGTVAAECLDSTGNVVAGATDTRTTAGAEYKIVLTQVPELQKPDGSSFQWTSNGSDAAFVTAQVVDAQGNIVPTAADNVTFSVSGPAQYMGGTQQVVADPVIGSPSYQDAFSKANSTVIPGEPYVFFHAPGDPELNFEGGLQKIALRSTFTPGTVTVTATAPGLVSGSVTLTSVAPPAPVETQAPAIIVPPVSTAVTQGYAATFTVSASGSGTLTYQWHVNNTTIAGATGTSYTTPVTTAANNNDAYAVTVTSASGYGSVSSNPAILTVSAPANAAITTQPASQTAVVGQTATLSVTASGSPQLNYAWFKNNAQVQSGSQSTYTTPLLTTPETDTYYVIVSNPLNQVQSANATLTVMAPVPVSITGSPVSQIIANNQPVVLSATVAGSAPFTYQWSFTPVSGQATIVASSTQLSNVFTYTVPAMSISNVGGYSVTVNNAANVPATSGVAQLTLAPPGVNLAYAMPATASSSQQPCTDTTTAPPLSGPNCLGAENAFDGNVSATSRWASAGANGVAGTTQVPGVDPSDLIVDLGSIQPFNTVVLNWESAYAAQYEIDYTNVAPTASTQWNVATLNKAGQGGTETLTFATVQGRYVRMRGLQRFTQYGYSLLEFQIYNLAECGGANERYTPSTTNSNLVLDNLLNLTWTRTIETNTAVGSQFTGVSAANYCASINMRLPTKAEAVSISGNNNATCAFPGTWSTWTSTVNPADSTETAIVSFNGNVTQNVTVNYPGATLCTAGTFAGKAPVITTVPQPTTVTLGNAAMFTVVANGVPSPTYQWSENNVVLAGATEPTYITAPTAATDNGSMFSVTVTNGSGTVTTTPVALTVSAAPVTPVSPTPPTDPTQPPTTPAPTNPGTVTTPSGSPTNPANPVIPAGPSNSGNGNTSTADTMVPGFGTGPVPAGVNLALGGVALSTGDEGQGLGAVNALDGNATSRWSSAFNNASDMQVDLGSVKPVGQVLLRWERAYGSQYQIRVSVDGQTWTPVFTQTQGLGGSENLVFPAVNARYVQFYGIQRSTQYGYSLWEMEVYGPVAAAVAAANPQNPVIPAGPANSGNGNTNATDTAITGFGTGPVPASVNLALGTTATSTGDEGAGSGPLNAIDGNLTTRWSSAFANASNLTINLGSVQKVGQVVLRWERAYGYQYQIRVSTDGQNFTPVFTQTAGQGGSENVTFPVVSAQYVQFYGIQRSSQYGYSLWDMEVYGPASAAFGIATQPASQTATVGSAATFTVTASGTGPFTYQWLKGGTAIAGATSASYMTSALTSADNGSSFSVAVSSGSGTPSTSSSASLTVTPYTTYAGAVGVDLINNTKGKYANGNVYVTIIGMDPKNNGAFSYINAAGQVVDFTGADSTATGHLTGPDGKSYWNYSFTLAQTTSLKMPPIGSARAYISLGNPLYVQVNADSTGKVNGYAGPNPQNASDPNLNTHFDWYELNYALNANGTTAIFINTTQVDEFGLPLVLDVWTSGGATHNQVGITESIAQLDSEYTAQVPAAFQPATPSDLRIFSPAKLSLGAGGANANYFANVLQTAWTGYASTPVTITLSGRQFTGTATGSTLTFKEVNPAQGNVGEVFTVQLPSTQDVLGCSGAMASGVNVTAANGSPQAAMQIDENGVQLQLQNQICSATNRGVLLTPASWANAAAYYPSAPANFYSQFWHNHSLGGLAYGFSYDDNNNQSTTIATQNPEHMTWTVGW